MTALMDGTAVDRRGKPVREHSSRRLANSLCDLDAAEFVNALSEDVSVYVGREKVSVGKRSVKLHLVSAFVQMANLRVQTWAVWSSRSVAVFELNVSCERMDGVQVAFPLTAVVRFRDDLICGIRLFT